MNGCQHRQGRIAETFVQLIALLIFVFPLSATAQEQYWVYTVRPDDTIWDLAERHTTSVLNWKRIQRVNNIPDGPDRQLKPGSKLRFPISILKHQPASALIVELQGDATLIRSVDDSRTEVTKGIELFSGDRVVTAPGSNLLIRFADGSELLLAAESDVTMDGLSAYGSTGMVDTRVRLQGGQVDTQVIPSKGPGSRYEIITPAAVAAVRGTNFRVSAESDQPIARSEVLEGKVAVQGGEAQQLVPAGFGVVAKAGEAPPPPKPLLPAPDLSNTETLQQRLPLAFSWAPTANADAYRFQIAPNEAFKQLLADEKTPTHRGFFQDLPDGDYVLRVRAIDTDGLEGLNALHRFTVDARPEPPLPIGLVNGVVIRDDRPEFGWSESADVTGYHIQVARDEAFQDVLLDLPALKDSRFEVEQPLAAGVYHWRIAALDLDGKQGPYSDVQTFEYRAIPDSPIIEAPAVGKDELSFNWKSSGEGLQYHFQFAADKDFNQVLIDRTTDRPGISIPRPASRRYYFRVQAIDASGYAGPYGSTQEFDVPPGSFWPLLIPLLLFI